MYFERAKRIRFSHCDPAGIVFYPRYAELFNEVVEDWFADALGADFRTLTEVYRLGIPVVRLEVEFLAPARFGDILSFRLSVAALGTTSLQLAICAYKGDTLAVRANLKTVLTSMDGFRSVPIEEPWRSKFGTFLQDPC